MASRPGPVWTLVLWVLGTLMFAWVYIAVNQAFDPLMSLSGNVSTDVVNMSGGNVSRALVTNQSTDAHTLVRAGWDWLPAGYVILSTLWFYINLR